jgi:hypothetical protein
MCSIFHSSGGPLLDSSQIELGKPLEVLAHMKPLPRFLEGISGEREVRLRISCAGVHEVGLNRV